MQSEPGCGLGCLLMIPVVLVMALIEGAGDKSKADRLAAKNRVLRLEAEQERLLAERAASAAERKRRKMLDAGYVLCPACEQWRDKLGENGVCEPCEIEAEIADVIDE